MSLSSISVSEESESSSCSGMYFTRTMLAAERVEEAYSAELECTTVGPKPVSVTVTVLGLEP